MASLAVLRELPGDVEVVRGARGVLAVRSARADAVRRAGFGPDGGGALEPSDLVGGRAPLSALALDGVPFVVRHYRHGGLLRGLTGERYADPGRPFRELLHAELLTRAGIPTPEVAAARAVRARPFGWRLELVTRRIDGAIDLAAFLELVRRGEVGARSRMRVLEAVGALVGALHRERFLHADLHPRNVLVAPGAEDEARPWIIDLDRSVRLTALEDGPRRDNLRRLARAGLRQDAHGVRFLTRSDLRRFLRGYERAAGRDPGSWRADWRAIHERGARRSLWHRVGWGLEEALASARSGRR